MRKVLECMILAVLPLALAAHAQTPTWDWSEKVAYRETHDPMVIALEGDRDIEVIYGELQYEDVDKWPKGKPLRLAYSAKTGTVLVDPDSGKSLPVVGGLKQHPVDVIVEHCMQSSKTKTAPDRQKCYAAGHELWDAEMNLWYGRLMASQDLNLLDDTGKQTLRQAQRQWLQYRDGQIKVIQAIYNHREGTIWKQVALQREIDLTKGQALHLASYFQAF